MIAEPSGGDHHLSLTDGSHHSGLTDNEIWYVYRTFGGRCTFAEISSALAGDIELSLIEHNYLAAALNDHLIDDGDTYRVAYRNQPEPHIPAARTPDTNGTTPQIVGDRTAATTTSQSGPLPDVKKCHDPAVHHCDPPTPVWINLHQLLHRTDHRARTRPEGVSSNHDDATGHITAWIAPADGPWLATVTLDLHRDGQPIMTTQALVPEWALKPRRTLTARSW